MKAEASLNSYVLRNFAIFAAGFFFVIMLLTVFIIIPKINHSIESQHIKDSQVELTLETELFTRFVQSQKNILQDLARFPSLTSAVMLSDGSSLAAINLFENVIISGNKGKLVLQDIEGTILIKTDTKMEGFYIYEEPWIAKILDGSQPYHFKLLNQDKNNFSFQISVPVIYDNYIEGILSAEITIPLSQVFVTQAFSEHVAFRLTQGQSVIFTQFEHIEIPREHSVYLSSPNLTFTLITDDGPINKKARTLRNTILLVLLCGLIISFILFAILGYRSLVSNDKYLKLKRSYWLIYAMPILVTAIGVAASTAAYVIITNVQQSSLEAKLAQDSKSLTQSFRAKINSSVTVLDSVKALYDTSKHVSRQDFKTFSQPLLANHKVIQALEWVPMVTHDKRNSYEHQARLDGLKNFSINERDENGKPISSLNRGSYFPVYFVEPMLGNEKSLGFDLGSNDKKFAALLKARNTGKKIATAKVDLIQGDKSQAGLLLFYAVYDNSYPLNGLASKQSQLKGFVVMALKAEDMVQESLGYELNSQNVFIQDITKASSPDTIFGTALERTDFSRQEDINLAGRHWRITYYSNFEKMALWWIPWLVLIIGLVFTVSIVLGLVNLIRRREVIELLVIQRTTELIESEEQYRAVVENAVDGLLTINEHGIIEKFNRAAENIFGYTATEVLGQNIKMLMPEPYHGEHDGYLQNYRNTGKKKIIGIGRNVEGKRKDGSIFPVDLSVSEIKIGNVRKFSGIIRDITERQLAEKDREKLIDKLMNSNDELERFAFVCSHDLQEPLRMIRSFSEKLQIHIAGALENDEKGNKYFHYVTDGAARAQTLIADILEYSSIDSDTQQLEDISSEDLIKIIQDNMQTSLQERNASITYDNLPILRGNKAQLFQLFQNLINNAIKYRKNDIAAQVHISAEESGEYWQFAIKDNGIGIEKRHVKKIFDVFQRLHRKSQYAGTGVGLSICKKVVERHNGSIWVHSEKGVGSTFYFTLLKATINEVSNEKRH